jgi:hypothetical protein
VILADTFGVPLARWSRSVDHFERLPAPVNGLEHFGQAIAHMVARYGIDDVIPTCEETFYVSMVRDRIPCAVWVSDIDLLRTLHDKWLFASHAITRAHVPDTVLVSEMSDWERSADYVFKPRFSRFASRTIIGRQVSYADFTAPSEWIAQRRIHGTELCVYSIWNQGRMTAIAIYHPRFRAGQGAGIYLEAAQHQEITSIVEQMGRSLAYHGQLSFDVILEHSTGRPYVIECNPRTTSGAHLLGTSVADAFTGNGFHQPVPGARCAIWYAMAMYHPRILLQRAYRDAPDVVYHRTDPLPSILQGLSALYFVASAWRNHCSVLEATTLDIEWNG